MVVNIDAEIAIVTQKLKQYFVHGENIKNHNKAATNIGMITFFIL